MDYAIQIPAQLRSHLKSLRKIRNLTQAQLGKLLGVGQVRIAEIAQNPAAISVEQLIKLLAALEAQVILRPLQRNKASSRDNDDPIGVTSGAVGERPEHLDERRAGRHMDDYPQRDPYPQVRANPG